jgi:endonuclease YncB( thermonuclease family)
MKFAVLLALAGLALSLASSAGAQTLSGSARVVDGDTLKVGGVTVRLFGIDAPEAGQACGDWRPGPEAAAALSAFIAGRAVACEHRDTDRYGRTVATCTAGDGDLGALMVAAGWAWAFTRYGHDYEGQEAAARAAGLGVHGKGCETPWTWRAQQRQGASFIIPTGVFDLAHLVRDQSRSPTHDPR